MYKYVSPTLQTELIESTNYSLNFASRRVIHNIGIDPIDEFNVTVHIITPFRYVNITQFIFKADILING